MKPAPTRHARDLPDAPIGYLLFAIALVIFALQLRSLMTYPIADSVQWGGDETYLMREYANQMTHGVMEYPEYYGGVHNTNGILVGSMWAAASIYGVPAATIFPSFSYVTIGRAVTAVLSLLLIVALFLVTKQIGISTVTAGAATLLLVTNLGFVKATHCARYDILTGLTMLIYAWLVIGQSRTWLTPFVRGVVAVMVLLFSVHLATLAIAATLVGLLRRESGRSPRSLLMFAMGMVASMAILVLTHAAATGEFLLFGGTGGFGSFNFVIRDIPIFRPFSRNVQLSNIEQRVHLFWTDATGVLYVATVALTILLTYGFWKLRKRRDGATVDANVPKVQRDLLLSTLGTLVLWLLFEGSRSYYLYHMVPVLLLGVTIVFEAVTSLLTTYRYGKYTAATLLLLGLVFQLPKALPADTLGAHIARDQSDAIRTFVAQMDRSNRKPRVLCDVAGLDRALIDSSMIALTLDQFQPPADAEQLFDKLHKNRIDYVILRSSPASSPFEPGRAALPIALAQRAKLVAARAGLFYDDGRYYALPIERTLVRGLDSLMLYDTRR